MLNLKNFTIRRLGAIAMAASLGLGLVGCKEKQMQTHIGELEAQNQELRARIDQQQQQLDNCDNEKKGLQNQMATLATPPSGKSDRTTGGGGGGEQVITIAGDALFNSGSATIRKEAKGQLDKIARELNGQWSGHRIRVVGHTDSDPLKKSKAKWGSNEGLSRARAQAVADYLSSKGVSAGRMAVEGKGSSEPKGDKKSSRRVEIHVLG